MDITGNMWYMWFYLLQSGILKQDLMQSCNHYECYIITSLRNQIVLTHSGWVTHICSSKLIIIGSDNGLSPGWRQVIIWSNAEIVLIRTSGTNFSETLSEIRTFSIEKMHLKMFSGNWRPFCFGLNVLNKIWCNDVIIMSALSLPYSGTKLF